MSVVTRRNKEIVDFLFRFLQGIFPKYPVVFEEQHEPRPLGPHLTFKFLTGFMRVGLDDEILVGPNGARTQRGVREFVISIKAVGSPLDGSKGSQIRAVDLLGEIQWQFEKPDNEALFDQIGLAVIDATNVTDTTELEDNVFIPRAVMDLRMRTQIVESISQSFIESINISGSIGTLKKPFTVSKPQP